METKYIDVLVIGGGISGLTAAIYTARANLETVVVIGEKWGQLGKTTDVENYPGFNNISGYELIDNIEEQAEENGVTLIEDYVENLDENSFVTKEFIIDDTIYKTKSVIIATGAYAKWLNLENEDKFKNKGLSACATCDGPLPIFKNKTLAVVGGGDTAMEEALFLTKFANKVYIINRSFNYKASKIMFNKAKNNDKIHFIDNHVVKKYYGNELLKSIDIVDNSNNNVKNLEISGLFMGIGHNPNTSFLENTGINLDNDNYIIVNNNMETNIDGVFACGDVHDKIYRQAVTASGYGCMAGLNCSKYIDSIH